MNGGIVTYGEEHQRDAQELRTLVDEWNADRRKAARLMLWVLAGVTAAAMFTCGVAVGLLLAGMAR